MKNVIVMCVCVQVNDEGYTPLMEASREGHEEMVALLLSQGAEINAQTEETQETAHPRLLRRLPRSGRLSHQGPAIIIFVPISNYHAHSKD